jgi:hypothetical protein
MGTFEEEVLVFIDDTVLPQLLDGFLAEKGFCNDVADGGWFVVFVD